MVGWVKCMYRSNLFKLNIHMHYVMHNKQYMLNMVNSLSTQFTEMLSTPPLIAHPFNHPLLESTLLQLPLT